ncbi:hypothetical protein ABK040_016287 [Willaertia magna]
MVEPNERNKLLLESLDVDSFLRELREEGEVHMNNNNKSFVNENSLKTKDLYNVSSLPSHRISSRSQSITSSDNDDELDSLMNELLEESQPHSPSNELGVNTKTLKLTSLSEPLSTMNNNNFSLKVLSPRKCTTVFLSNQFDKLGYCSYLSIKRCNDIRCMKCDFKVLHFDRKKWKSTVDYLFFRNNYPETVKKGFELNEDINVTSYCCQCSWVTVERRTNIKSLTNLYWYCGGNHQQ